MSRPRLPQPSVVVQIKLHLRPDADADLVRFFADIPPYRRDFDTLKYAEASYSQRPGRETRDPATHMKQQLYPGEA